MKRREGRREREEKIPGKVRFVKRPFPRTPIP